MKPILSLVVAAVGLLDVATAITTAQQARLNVPGYQGCFSSNAGATLVNNTDIYNSQGKCVERCLAAEYAVELLSDAKECWCGQKLPSSVTKVDESKCNRPCIGYNIENCGGIGFFDVYLSGLTSSAEEDDAPISSSTSSSIASSPTATSPTSPSVVTSPGQTVVVTQPANSSSTSAPKKSGPNVAAIAAGVVVGFVGLAAVALGIFFFMRNKKRREIEEEHRRNAAVSSFIGNQKPPTTSAGSSFTDTRLDPVVMAGRRISNGSIADNQDYSRRILKVTNA